MNKHLVDLSSHGADDTRGLFKSPSATSRTVERMDPSDPSLSEGPPTGPPMTDHDPLSVRISVRINRRKKKKRRQRKSGPATCSGTLQRPAR